MPGISQHFVKGLVKDAYDYMFESYDAYEEIWPNYYEEKKVDGDYWQRTTVVNTGTWRRTTEAEGFQPQNAVEGFTVYARVFDYTQATSLTYNVVKDHQKVTNLIREIAGDWGITAKETREEFYARPFNQGGITTGDWIFNGTPESQAVTDASGLGAYDGTSASPIPFFNLSNNTRSSKGGATYYNGFAHALTPTNLKTVWTHMVGTNNRRENDTRMKLIPNCILFPTALKLTVSEILESTLIAYTSTNTKNVLQALFESPIHNPYLTDTDAWFIGCKKKGLIALNRQEPVIDFFQDKKNRCFWATAEMRIGMMMWNWRFWCGSQFSSS